VRLARACSLDGSLLNELRQALTLLQAAFNLLASGKLDTYGRQL
jgi:hypothetical protein